MTGNAPSTQAYSDEQRQARGFFGFVRMLGTATEHLFRRSYEEQSQPGPSTAELQALIKSREAKIDHLTAVLETIGEGVIMQDVDGRIIMMNDAAYQLLGSQKAFWESELSQLHKQSAHLESFTNELEPIGGPIRVEINNRILGAQLAAVSDGRHSQIGTVLVLRDVTRTALAERLKDDFITQISHELRTPLTAIKGMSDVLLSQPEDRPPNRRFLEAISRNVDVLDRMIVELLDISEITSGSFVIHQEELVLDELVWGVVRGLQPRWERAKLEVQIMCVGQDKTQILGDSRRLRWALGHILENSINYTLKGGRIMIRIGEISRGHVILHVEDTGVGIREFDLPHIFERFYRGEARTSENKLIDPRGLGQGLFIARAVTEAHGGYLALDSKVGIGTIVTLALPLAAELQPTEPLAIEP